MSSESEHISEEDFEVMEQYLRGEMNGNHRVVFEKRMADDTEFRQSVDYYKHLIEGVEMAALKARLNTYHDDIEHVETAPEKDKPAGFPLLKFLVAASVIFAVGLATWFIAFQQSPQEKLYAAYFKPDPGLITPMSSTDNYEFYLGMIDYKQKNYEEAIYKWKPLLQAKAQNDTLTYFLGAAELARGKADKAIPYLRKSVAASGSAFIDDAYFYLGLAYLKQQNRKAAIRALHQSHSERARQLSADLEKN